MCQGLHHRHSVPALISNERGGYDFLEGIEPYSSGVVAQDGFEVVHAALEKLVPWRVVLLRLEVTNKGNLHSRTGPCHPPSAC